MTPSMAITRHLPSHAPGVPGEANGWAIRANNSAIGASPSRARAWAIAPVVGTFHCCDQVRANRSPCTRWRITSSYPSRNSANAITK